MYLTVAELRSIATLVDTIDELDESLISIGKVTLYDRNGESVGEIHNDGGSYAFYPVGSEDV